MRVCGVAILKKEEFYSNDIESLREIVQKSLSTDNKQDPASIYYERHLARPKISWLRICGYVIILILLFLLSTWLLFVASHNFTFSLIVSFLICLLYILFFLKSILICLVKIYQRYAPDKVRMKCRFEPSCSQYMIMAIQKYGAVKGLVMGIKRLSRCKVGNGGYDFP